MSNFTVYLIGALLVITGLGYAAFIAGISLQWVFVGILVCIGIFLMVGIVKSRRGPSRF